MSITNDPQPSPGSVPPTGVTETPPASPGGITDRPAPLAGGGVAEKVHGWATLGLLNRYQWFVFIVCCLAWDMDCMDQQLFVLARRPAMTELVPKVTPNDPRIENHTQKLTDEYAKQGKPAPSGPQVIASLQAADINDAATYATSFFMLGW